MSDGAATPLFEGNPVLGLVEKMLLRQLQASTAARTRLKALSGKTLALEITGIGLNIYIECEDESIGLRTEFNDNADVIISGTPLALLSFARTQDQSGVRGGRVTFTGDLGVAQDFQKLFAVLSPDFEEELSRLIGDAAAYRVHTAGKELFAWARQTADRLTEQLAVVVTERRRDTPTREELDDFLDGVDKIRADVERAAVRLERLRQQTAAD